MQHPFQAIPLATLSIVFISCLLATLVVMFLLSWSMSRPKNFQGKFPGIIEFELAGETEKIDSLLKDWNQAWPGFGTVRAAFNTGLDFLFIVLYSNTIGLGCIWAAQVAQLKGWGFFFSLGLLLAWGQWGAALFDVVENIALIQMLFGRVVKPWPQIAKWCAIPKFALVIAGIVFCSFILARTSANLRFAGVS